MVTILEDTLLSVKVRLMFDRGTMKFTSNTHIDTQRIFVTSEIFVGQPQTTDACQWKRNPDGRYTCAVEGCEDKDRRYVRLSVLI